MTDNSFLLLLGQFFTSPGFGGLATATAAIVAFVNVTRTSEQNRVAHIAAGERDRAAQVEDDERQRWWELLNWLYDHREHMDQATAQGVMDTLESFVKTKQQAAILLAVNKLVRDS